MGDVAANAQLRLMTHRNGTAANALLRWKTNQTGPTTNALLRWKTHQNGPAAIPRLHLRREVTDTLLSARFRVVPQPRRSRKKMADDHQAKWFTMSRRQGLKHMSGQATRTLRMLYVNGMSDWTRQNVN